MRCLSFPGEVWLDFSPKAVWGSLILFTCVLCFLRFCIVSVRPFVGGGWCAGVQGAVGCADRLRSSVFSFGVFVRSFSPGHPYSDSLGLGFRETNTRTEVSTEV